MPRATEEPAPLPCVHLPIPERLAADGADTHNAEMIRKATPTARISGILVAAAMLFLSVAVPVLDAGLCSGLHEAVSQQDAPRTAPGHDHALCNVLGATPALPTHSQLPDLRAGPSHDGPTVDVVGILLRNPSSSKHSRAPPIL
jgi:hypothetical protein